jgi:hypothetical protein
LEDAWAEPPVESAVTDERGVLPKPGLRGETDIPSNRQLLEFLKGNITIVKSSMSGSSTVVSLQDLRDRLAHIVRSS